MTVGNTFSVCVLETDDRQNNTRLRVAKNMDKFRIQIRIHYSFFLECRRRPTLLV